jgi:hypothetical protein
LTGLKDFFRAFLKKFDRVLRAVEVLTLPAKLAVIDSVCRTHIAGELSSLSHSFALAGNTFPPTGEAGFDHLNSVVSSLDAFQLCCGGNLKETAAKLFREAKQSIQEKCVRHKGYRVGVAYRRLAVGDLRSLLALCL